MEDVLLKIIADLESSLDELRDELASKQDNYYPGYFQLLDKIKLKENELQSLRKVQSLSHDRTAI